MKVLEMKAGLTFAFSSVCACARSFKPHLLIHEGDLSYARGSVPEWDQVGQGLGRAWAGSGRATATCGQTAGAH